MADYLEFLLKLVNALSVVVNKIDLSVEKRLTRRIVQTHLLLQTIIDDAERVFHLIENAESEITEHGEKKFSKIIQENFRSQQSRIEELIFQLRDPDMSSVLKHYDRKLSRRLEEAIYGKRCGIFYALERLAFSNLKLQNGELLVVTRGRKKIPAFPEMEKQRKMLSELDNSSRSLWETICNKIKLSDLL